MTDSAERKIADLEAEIARMTNLRNIWKQRCARFERVIDEVIGAVEGELPGCPNCD